MGYGINQEDVSLIEESFRKSDFCEKIVFFPYRLFTFVFDCFYYGPGIGKIGTEKIVKHRVAKINTSVGRLSFPVVKIPCFDLNFGFFTGTGNIHQGLHGLDNFLEKNKRTFPEHVLISSIESYWILNYRRPKDINGKKEVYCFIENELDDLIYIYHLQNNELIDYEKIIDNYEAEVENLDFMEKIEKEIVTIQTTEQLMKEMKEMKETEEMEEMKEMKEMKEMNGGCRKRIKKDNYEKCCISNICFEENSTSIPRTQDL